MSSTSSPTLIIDVRSRRTENGVVFLTFLAVLLAPWLGTTMTFAAASAITIAAAALLACGFFRAGWLGGGRRIERVSWISDGRWILMDRTGTAFEAALGAGTRVGRRIVWLEWRHGDRAVFQRRSMLLTLHDVPANDLRRLIVRLRIDGLRSVESRATAVA